VTKRWDKYSAWFTPPDVAEQGCWAAAQVGVSPETVIDLGAGAGSILSRAPHVWPRAHLAALEIREEERPHLDRWAHEVVIGDFREVVNLGLDCGGGGPRLLIGNPPYGASDDDEADDLTTQALHWGFRVLSPGDWILFLLRKSYEEGEAASHFFSPASEGGRSPLCDFRVQGRAQFRRGVNAAGNRLSGDFIGHRWVLWRVGVHPQFWKSAALPPLPSSSLSYAIRPGTELVAGKLHEGLRPRFPELAEVSALLPDGGSRTA